MQRNPYSPPQASEAEVRAATPRPISAWLLLLPLVAASAVFAFGAARLLWLVASGALEIQIPLAATWAIAWRLACAVGTAVLAVAIVKRSRWGRWLGLASILGFAAWNLLRQDTEQYPNEAQAAGAFLGKVFLVPILFFWWSYAFAFSTKAKNYFLGGNSDA